MSNINTNNINTMKVGSDHVNVGDIAKLYQAYKNSSPMFAETAEQAYRDAVERYITEMNIPNKQVKQVAFTG